MARGRRRFGSNLFVAAGLTALATVFGFGYGGLTIHLHNKQMRRNYEEERRIALENLMLGNITKKEFDALHCNREDFGQGTADTAAPTATATDTTSTKAS
eukprot:jgi/Bigna1/141488/aug1.63_g16196